MPKEKDCKCKWCSKIYTVYGGLVPFTYSYPDHHPYCSKKCMNEAEGGSVKTSHKETEQISTKKSGGLFGMMDALDEDNAKMDAAIDKKISSISTIQIGGTPDEVSAALNQLVTIASSKPDSKVREAICEKMEFGIMKLRTAGANSEADYFENKQKSIKPKWYEKSF